MRAVGYTSEFGRWEEVARVADPRLRPYVHGYFATSSSLVRPVRERHLPAVEVPMVLNFGAPHTTRDPRGDAGPERLDHAWVTGLQTGHRLSDATGERSFMVVRFTPLGAHRFLRLSMHELTDRVAPLDQLDSTISSLVRDHVMVAGGWEERFDAVELLIGGRLAGSEARPHLERAWSELASTRGQTPIASLAADAPCSHRELIRQFRSCCGIPPKKAARLLRFNHVLAAVTQLRRIDAPSKPYLEGPAVTSTDTLEAGWARVAAECGYSDQPHLVHEFRAFAGVTPSEFLRGISTPAR